MIATYPTCPPAHHFSQQARTTVTHPRYRRIVAVAAVTVILSGCDLGLATRGGLVHNLTDQDLVIEPAGVSDPSRATVPARRAHRWNAYHECLGTGVAVFAPDGERLATLDEQICDGRRLVIEPDDLSSPAR